MPAMRPPGRILRAGLGGGGIGWVGGGGVGGRPWGCSAIGRLVGRAGPGGLGESRPGSCKGIRPRRGILAGRRGTDANLVARWGVVKRLATGASAGGGRVGGPARR